MFGKKDLKTGYVLEIDTGRSKPEFAMVLLGTSNGDIAVGETWFPLDSYCDEQLFVDSEGFKVVRVYRFRTNVNYANAITRNLSDQARSGVLVWERKEKTEQQLKIEQLEATIARAAEEIKQLKEMK